MKNPLIKRLPRELKSDIGKYIVIFLFLTMLISLVSGFLVVDNSMSVAIEDGFSTRNVEHGHITFDKEPDSELIENIENNADITLYDLKYFEEEIFENKNIRVYTDRENVNIVCLMSGEMPVQKNEIAIDRMFADNNKINIGDTLEINGESIRISGFVALPDYTSLFESNTDMMLDAIGFGVGIMTAEGFDFVESPHIFNNYAWKYNGSYDREDKVLANELSENLVEVLADTVMDYDEKMADNGDLDKIIKINDYVPQYLNQAINFAPEDMGGDKAFFLLFTYIVVAVLAFIFAVTTSNTLNAEAGVIGTLRASGFSRGELTRHYLILPVAVTLISAIAGNVLGYTYFKGVMGDLYYATYSVPKYKIIWNADAFLLTTVFPLILMFVINLIVISSRMKLSPLQFLRHELKSKPKKKAFRLNTKIPFITRFRIRIIFQNMSSYVVMAVGVILGAAIILFGNISTTIFADYSVIMIDSMICDYQYVLKNPVETENENAEKYGMKTFEFKYENYVKDEISVYGISDNSRYVNADISENKVAISETVADKYNIKPGDEITLSDPYTRDKSFNFTVDSIYDYQSSLAIFVSLENFNSTFENDSDYFTGYFSDEELNDIPEEDIVTVLTLDVYTKLTDQMEHSMGAILKMFGYFGVVMFVLIMYILSKQIIERNFQSISMCKILGFKNSEISKLYIISTSVVVVLSLLVSVPISYYLLKWGFSSFLYTKVTGYFPYIVHFSSFVEMIILGIVSYAVVAVIQIFKISRISKSEALKNRE